MTPQVYGRYVEAQLAEHYHWGHQRGSGNRWYHPSDTWNQRYQMEVKTYSRLPMRLNLDKVWHKIAQEAQHVGREPLIVVARNAEEAWGVYPVWELPLKVPFQFVRGVRAWNVAPYCDIKSHIVYWEGEIPPRFPLIWMVQPLEEVEDIVDGH